MVEAQPIFGFTLGNQVGIGNRPRGDAERNKKNISNEVPKRENAHLHSMHSFEVALFQYCCAIRLMPSHALGSPPENIGPNRRPSLQHERRLWFNGQRFSLLED